jgi:C-terminal processing protease CtpA/Prc
LLSRFNLTFDFYRQRIFFEPTKNFKAPYEYNMTGLTMRRGQGDFLQITLVTPDSPGEEAGLKVDDRVLQIDGRAATDYDYFELQPLLKKEGAVVTLLVEHEGKQRKVSLTLRRLL